MEAFNCSNKVLINENEHIVYNIVKLTQYEYYYKNKNYIYIPR